MTTVSPRHAPWHRWFLLSDLERHADAGLLVLRLTAGVFLIVGTWDNVTSAERMQEFVGFLAANGFVWPELMAPVSVWAQFIAGILFVLGLAMRWAGLVMTFNFIVALIMVHAGQDLRDQWPALVLVVLSLYFALRGAGRYAVDALPIRGG